MAITIFHRVINNRVIVINKGNKKEPINKAVKINGNMRVNKHTLSEVKTYD
jgi:hypothetical protein